MVLRAVTLLILLAQLNQMTEEGPSLDPYLGRLTEYRQGELDGPVEELAGWPESRVQQTFEPGEVISAIHEVRYPKSNVRSPRAFKRHALTSKPYEQPLAQRVSRQAEQDMAVRFGASVAYSSMASFSQP